MISNRDTANLDWEAALQQSVGICYTAKKAYEIALFLAGITRPDKLYRKCLNTLNARGAVQISQLDGEQSATIVVTKIYSNRSNL